MKLETRVTLAVTAVTASALIASFVAVSLLVLRDEMRDLDQALLSQARTAGELALVRSPSIPDVTDGSAEVPESFGLITRYEAAYDARGRLASATRSFAGEPPTLQALGVSRPVAEEGVTVNLVLGGVVLRGVVIPVGARGYSLLYAVSRRTVDEDTTFLNRVLSGIFFATMVLTSLVARWLSGRLARDVQSIAAVARAVAQGDLGARAGDGVRSSAETRALASDLDHMIEQLGALVAAQRTFISHAAHELRSPLATLRGELQLALRRPREATEYRETIAEVLTDVEALSGLAEDLLTLARLQQARAPDDRTTTVREAVQEALRMARGPAEAKGVALSEPAEGEASSGLTVRGARGEVARALRNLVDNAVAHSPERGEVAIDVRREGDRVSIAVVDEGPGVTSMDGPNIFAPFYRGSKDQSGDHEGAGLGLAIAREIARACGGDVVLDAGYEGGARFVLELPVAGGP